MEIYASFTFQKSDLELYGVLSHQMIKFTKSVVPGLIPYMKIEKVTFRKLVKAIRKRLCDNFSVYRLLQFEKGVTVLLFAIPTVKFDIKDRSQLKLVSSHEGLKIVLLGALADLECSYTQISPDIVFDVDEDPLTDWSLTVTTYEHFQKVKLIQGLQRGNYCTSPNKATLHVKNVRLSKILYVIQHTSTVGPKLIRDIAGPFMLRSKRKGETFRMPLSRKTSRRIIRDIQLEITGPKITLSGLWNLAMDYLDGFF